MNRRSLTTYLLVVPAGLMLLLSGCARLQQPRQLGWCTVGGIAAGAAIGAGIGYAVGDNSTGKDGSRSRVIAGSLAGAGSPPASPADPAASPRRHWSPRAGATGRRSTAARVRPK